jgi:hypothetical protein
LYTNAGLGAVDIGVAGFYSGATLTNYTNFLLLTGSTLPTALDTSAQRGYNQISSGLLFGGALIDRPGTGTDFRSSNITFGAINVGSNLNFASPSIGFYLICKSGTESACTYTTATPEPSLLGLLIPSLIAIGYGARRRFHKE